MKLFLYIIMLISAAVIFAEAAPRCLDFNGSDQYISIENNDLQLSHYFTIESWFKADSFSDGAALIDNAKTDEDGAFWGYAIYTKEPDTLYIRIGNGIRDTCVTTGGIPRGQWQHLAITFDRFKQDENIVIFINGQVRAKGDFAAAPAYPVYMNNYGIFLGKSYDGFNNVFFRGSLDELRIWNRVRENREIRENICMAPDSMESGLLAYYDFNDTEQNILYDLSGKGHNGSLINYTGSEAPFSYAQLLPYQPDDVGFDRIVFHWNAAAEYDSYLLDVSLDSGFSSPLAGFPVDGIQTNYYIMDDIEPGVYYFRVKGHYKTQNPAAEPWSLPLRAETVYDAATPVHLSEFTANLCADAVRIFWMTESQTENAYFCLERREDLGEWTRIARISGAGTNAESMRYEHIDYEIHPGRQYEYRLIDISYSGACDSSGIRSVRVPEIPDIGQDLYLASVRPNPFNPQTVIGLQILNEAHVMIRIFSANGRCCALLCNKELQPGFHRFSWMPQNLPAGIYILNLHSGNISVSRKLLYIK